MLTSKRIDGDYSIVSTDGAGIITLTANLVNIPGDLTITGTTTTINATNLEVADKIIGINVGEAGPGVLGTGISGIEVNRGDNDAPGNFKALLVWDENLSPSRWVINLGEGGADVEIVTIALGAGTPMFNLIDDTSPTLGGDLDVAAQSIVTGDGPNDIALVLGALNTGDITLTAESGTSDIILTVTGLNGEIILDGPVLLQGGAPNTTPVAETAVYFGADTGGGTQIHFENDTDTGELVSKTKAMVFALIF